ncbi:MAG: M43 family zinc metalloprotease [Bacteroidota bacterium]
MKNLFIPIVIGVFLLSCNESESLQVDQIRIQVNREYALAGQDSILIDAEIIGPSPAEAENITLEYLANGVPLTGPFFLPQERGNFELSARYESTESNRITVEVFDLADDIEALNLTYDGYSLLTTHAWSVAGTFTLEGLIGSRSFPISSDQSTFYANGEPLTSAEGLHFPEAGDYEIVAEVSNIQSNTIQLKVRPEKAYPLKTLPVVFHVYSADVNLRDLDRLIDTLNNSFNRQAYATDQVLSGSVNPNAVDLFLRFERAQTSPEGVRTDAAGVQIIPAPNGIYSSLTQGRFNNLEEEYGWDPDEYINIWLADGYEFSFPPFDGSSEGIDARGIVYSPILESGSLEGLPSLEFPDPRNPIGAPEEFSQAILLRRGSVAGEHPDYIVNRMGFFLGLFDTFEFSCAKKGDYCADTFFPDFDQLTGSIIDKVPSCEGPDFFLNNHMSINRNYTSFTYDQRERVRFVLENALFRP